MQRSCIVIGRLPRPVKEHSCNLTIGNLPMEILVTT